MSELIDRMLSAQAEMDKLPLPMTSVMVFGQTYQVRPSVGDIFGISLFPEDIRIDTLMAPFAPRVVRGLERRPK